MWTSFGDYARLCSLVAIDSLSHMNAKIPEENPPGWFAKVRRWRRLLEALTLITLIFQAVFIYSANRIAQRAANAADESVKVARETVIAEERPWVAVDPVSVNSVLVEDSRVEIIIDLAFRNIGKTPAFSVLPRALMFDENRGERYILKQQKEMCESMRAGADNYSEFGVAMFPGDDPKVLPVVGAIDGELFADAVKHDALERASRVSVNLPSAPAFAPIIVGCVLYQFGNPRTSHVTGFGYQLHDHGPAGFNYDFGKQIFLSPKGYWKGGRVEVAKSIMYANSFFAD